MTDYVKITDYAGKDALTTGNPAKLVKGTEIGADFDAVVVAIATKADEDGATLVNVDINSGAIDGTTIGGTTAAAITGTTITGTTITGTTGFVGAHNGTVGATTPAAGTFTTLATTGNLTIGNASGDAITCNAATMSVPNGLAITGAVTGSGIVSGNTELSPTVPVSTTSTTLVAGDAGKCVALSADVTVPDATFAAGNIVSIYNNTSGDLTITQGSGLTLRRDGSSTGATRTLTAYSLATIWFHTASICIISGRGIS